MMLKVKRGFERLFVFGAVIVFGLASAAAELLRSSLHFHKERVAYGMDHLPSALFSVFLFSILFAVLQTYLSSIAGLEGKSTSFYMVALGAIFVIFWLPVLLSGGFALDDWILLGAASIRKIIFLHPTYIWNAIDTIDGNFRPLGTVVYFGSMLKLFGVHPLPFLAGNFVIGFLSGIVAFFIVRELGYSKIAGAAAAILYVTRDLTYTENAWVSALGDGLAILFCGLSVLLVLRATKRRGLSAFSYQVTGWVCFCVAALGKQSAFAVPAIIAMLLFLRPGKAPEVPLSRRIRSSLLALTVYGATAGVLFFHAKSLLHENTPYALGLSWDGVIGSFAYVAWYFVGVDLAGLHRLTLVLPGLVGVAILIGGVVLVRRVPRTMGNRPRDIAFVLLSGSACLALLIPLGSRVVPYYGAMFAFWLSIGLGVALTRFGDPDSSNVAGRRSCLVFCVLVMVGYLDVRVKQTAIIPSGGYLWGTFGMDTERGRYEQLSALLSCSPPQDMLVLADFPPYPSDYVAMILLLDPGVKRVLVYDSKTKSYFANDQGGNRPRDEFETLHDRGAFNWSVLVSEADAARTIANGKPLWIEFRDGKISPIR